MSRNLIQTFLNLATEIADGTASTAGREQEDKKMFEILREMKEKGPDLDHEHREEMNRVQAELTKLCQRRELNPEMRLMMLELIEVCL